MLDRLDLEELMPDAHPQFVLTHWSACQIAEGRGRHALLAHSTSSISRQVASCERLWFGDVDADAARLADDLVVARDKHESAGATLVDHVPVTVSVREPEHQCHLDRPWELWLRKVKGR